MGQQSSPPDSQGYKTIHSRKRNANQSPVQANITGTPKRNRPHQDASASTSTDTTTSSSTLNDRARIPSMILDACVNSQAFLLKFKKSNPSAIIESKLRINKMHVFTESNKTHRSIISLAEKENIKYTIFQVNENPEDKPLRVVIRNIPDFIPELEVQEALIDKGFTVEKVCQMKSQTRKLPMFLVYIAKKDNYEDIHNLKSLLFARIKVEPYQPRLLQCYNCQEFLHGAKVCKREIVCMHCAGAHDTRTCPDKSKAKCANCHGDHKAFDYNCPVRIKIQNRREMTTRTSASQPPQKPDNNKFRTPSKPAPIPLTPYSRRHIITPKRSNVSVNRKLNFPPLPNNPLPNPQPQNIPQSPTNTVNNLAKVALEMAIDRIKSLNNKITDIIFTKQLLILNLKCQGKENSEEVFQQLIDQFISELLAIS